MKSIDLLRGFGKEVINIRFEGHVSFVLLVLFGMFCFPPAQFAQTSTTPAFGTRISDGQKSPVSNEQLALAKQSFSGKKWYYTPLKSTYTFNDDGTFTEEYTWPGDTFSKTVRGTWSPVNEKGVVFFAENVSYPQYFTLIEPEKIIRRDNEKTKGPWVLIDGAMPEPKDAVSRPGHVQIDFGNVLKSRNNGVFLNKAEFPELAELAPNHFDEFFYISGAVPRGAGLIRYAVFSVRDPAALRGAFAQLAFSSKEFSEASAAFAKLEKEYAESARGTYGTGASAEIARRARDSIIEKRYDAAEALIKAKRSFKPALEKFDAVYKENVLPGSSRYVIQAAPDASARGASVVQPAEGAMVVISVWAPNSRGGTDRVASYAWITSQKEPKLLANARVSYPLDDPLVANMLKPERGAASMDVLGTLSRKIVENNSNSFFYIVENGGAVADAYKKIAEADRKVIRAEENIRKASYKERERAVERAAKVREEVKSETGRYYEIIRKNQVPYEASGTFAYCDKKGRFFALGVPPTAALEVRWIAKDNNGVYEKYVKVAPLSENMKIEANGAMQLAY